jgi:putative hydrolase of the HAD superfamily
MQRADRLDALSKPSAILFDFGGTLDCPSHWLDRFLKHYVAAGFELTREELDPAFDFATKAGYAAGNAMERFKLNDLVRFLVGNQFEYLRGQGPDRFSEALNKMDSRERFRSVERVRESFLKETVAGLACSKEILAKLKPQFRLGIISNWYGNLDAIIAEAGMSRMFDAIIDSTRVHAFKPDEAIFRAALKALHSPAEQTAMVGDSMNKDMAPAHRIGMLTVFLRSIGHEHESAAAPAQSSNGTGNGSGSGFAPDYTIDSLEEILTIAW